MKGPLEGIKVVEITRALAGPFVGLVLSQLGAEVIKIEEREKGDESRSFAPFSEQGESWYFSAYNAGKKSISLNLKEDSDREILFKLLKKSDVILENSRPGVMDSLGLSFSLLEEKFPQLIIASCSGFGQTGPNAKDPAYDMTIQAMSGLMSITGDDKRQEATRVGIPLGDLSAALFTVIGILSSLYARNQSEKASRVDVAMLDSLFALLENGLMRYFSTMEVPLMTGNRHPSMTPFQTYQASDGEFAIAIANEKLFETFSRALNLDILVEDPRFSSNRKRIEHREELREILESKFKKKPLSHWLELLKTSGIPCSKINNIKEITEDPQIEARNMIVDIQSPLGDPMKAAGNPIKLSGYPDPKTRAKAPKLDEHREEILRDLGIEED